MFTQKCLKGKMTAMKKQYLELGQIVSVQGIKGEVRINPWSDDPAFLLEFDCFYLDKGNKKINVEKSRVQKNIIIAKLEGIDTVEEAQKMRNQIIYMNRDDVELEEGCYFIQDLVGLCVIDADDASIVYGEITEVSETGANDVYHIKAKDGKLYYIPAIPQVVIETNVDNGIMKIRPLKGLFDDED